MTTLGKAICMVLLWLIYKKRNRIVFADVVDVKKFKEEDIFPALQSTSLLWLSNRKPSLKMLWDSWAQSPFGPTGYPVTGGFLKPIFFADFGFL